MTYGERFLNTLALLHVVRHEEVELLTRGILGLRSHDGDKDWPLYNNLGDEMSQQEVWNMALDRAIEILEGRMDLLGEVE